MTGRSIAVVTGASSGLGEVFARAIAAHPAFADLAQIWLIARRERRLDAIARELPRELGVPIAADLATPAGVEAVLARVREQRPVVRMFVASAGVGHLGPFADQDAESLARMLDLNIRALSLLTHGLLPSMSRGSRIVLVASAAGYVPSPYFAAYAASKSFVISLAHALREELRSRGIEVCAVCPGPVATEFFAVAGMRGPISAAATPEQVVALALRDALAGRAVSHDGAASALVALVARALPRRTLAWLAGRRNVRRSAPRSGTSGEPDGA
ncbi:SDR family NAD(P)-dependent oxidoreductase [Nannocystis pusilla]|uniref:SDR family NAD(P)-dependent oxidoreductase n=1 Tax=Nannocystis pusilla TaxID=889268 RepID=A0ABS7TTB8_9BACT|nr:SDR family NAD(P)-dependent oxidoreductase [Nannocystis pusilla]MBZ5711480.1 SDR family NAD(P)-dependent oxidoreductase [Nannocystis pusilla]